MYKQKKINKNKNLIIFGLIFIIFIFIVNLYFFSEIKSEKNKKNSSNNIIKNEDILEAIEEKIEKIKQKKLNKIIKIVSKEDFIIYKKYDFFDVPTEKIEINKKIVNGFFIKKDGLVITNKHILDKNNLLNYVGITNDKKQYNLKKIWISKKEDLAVFKIISDSEEKKLFPKVDFVKDFKNIKNGNFIISLNFNNKIFFGNLLEKNKKINYIDNLGEKKYLYNLFETDFKNNSGDSGSPIFNLNGEVIGINTLIKNGKTYSIPLNKNKIKNILYEIFLLE